MTSEIAKHIQSLNLVPPKSFENVYKDECAYTFDSPVSISPFILNLY